MSGYPEPPTEQFRRPNTMSPVPVINIDLSVRKTGTTRMSEYPEPVTKQFLRQKPMSPVPGINIEKGRGVRAP